jgi:two-component system, cell cycle sensor histidine kinase and response regulator CckA
VLRSVILLVEDDPAHAELARRALQSSQHAELFVVETLADARAFVGRQVPDVVVSDLELPDGSAIELLADALPLVVMTSQGDEHRAVAAMKGGALDYVVKSPEMYRELPVTIERALRAARAERERARAEASLRESEERFRQLAESIQEAFWLYDVAAHRMVYVSPAWERIYGVSAARVLESVEARFESVHADDRERVRTMLASGAPGGPLDHEYRIVTPSGTRWIGERVFPVSPLGGPDGPASRVAGLGTDVTRRRELETALRQSQKMEAVGQLAGGVAHDFNNMLTAILASGEQMKSVVVEPEQFELCDMIVSAAERAAELTRKLLAFSRKGKVLSIPVDVHGVLRDTVTLLERSIDRIIRVTLELGADAPVVVGDATQLQNALLNLGINARDAMPDGGELSFSTTVRSLDEAACAAMPFAVAPGRYVQISVRDTGTGIAPEHVGRVFEPFFTTKPVGKGTGLGLAAVYGTAVEHGGAITVSSEAGRGTVFRLYLPVTDRLPRAVERIADVPRGTGLVLLVDDEPLVRAAGAQLVRSLGYRVVTANDGAEGLRAFADHRRELVAVLCDMVMPELSGGEASARMRALDPSVPIVICSGFPRDERVNQLGADAVEFLAKPFHRGELAAVLARVARRPPVAPS